MTVNRETLTTKIASTPWHCPEVDSEVDVVLSALSMRYGDAFDVSAQQVLDHRRHAVDSSADTCITCDAPKDLCSECDAADPTCNNQHDIICIRCDEGDVCRKEDGSCNLIGDIPCGKDDK